MFEAVVIGVSAGGISALTTLIPALPEAFGLAIVVVQHIREGSDDFLARHLGQISTVRVKEAEEKEAIRAGTVYIAPPGYHLLVEDDRTFSLSAEPAVSFARPSIDVLFECAAEVYSNRLVGVILTGANSDGAHGLGAVKQAGGLTVVQDPETAESPTMPRAALDTTEVDHVLALDEIAVFLSGLGTAAHAQEAPAEVVE